MKSNDILLAVVPDEGSQISQYSKKFIDILDFNNIPFSILNPNDSEFWDKINRVDYVIYRWGHIHTEAQQAKSILPIIEFDIGKKVFPNQKTCWHFDDKIKQYYLLKHYKFPIIPTWVFWNKKIALDWLKDASYPLVIKLKEGAGSSNVKLINSKNEAKKYINALFDKGIVQSSFGDYPKIISRAILSKYLRKHLRLNNKPENYWQIHRGYVYFQEFLPDNEYDIRITTIGKRAFGFIRKNRPGDFRASGSGLISYEIAKIDLQCVKLALAISDKLGFQSMSYDFLYDKNGNICIGEVSYTYQDRAIYNCSGFWDAEFNWHQGHYWPQYFQLIDLISDTYLKQPSFE